MAITPHGGKTSDSSRSAKEVYQMLTSISQAIRKGRNGLDPFGHDLADLMHDLLTDASYDLEIEEKERADRNLATDLRRLEQGE